MAAPGELYDWSDSRHTRSIEWWWKGSPTLDAPYPQNEDALQNLLRLGFVVGNYDLVDREERLKFLGESPDILSTPELKYEYLLSDVAVIG